jgi:hypothetical protein
VTQPAITFPGAQMTSGYVITENLSEYEMRLKTSNVDPAPTSEIPFLPDLSKGAGIFRAEPDWSVSISLDRLEKAESRAAFVAWAEMTTALRADGTEWHRASYRLQNRSLQFLPVRLPEGAELMSARVAGQNVRADTGQVDGRAALLVPLIKTKPGDLSYDVELVYRISGPLPGWRVKREFQEPELPGITVERTLWNVWLPDDRKLETSGGNMEPVLGDLNKTEKLEGKLQELKQLVTIANSSRISQEARGNAMRNLTVLQKELEAGNRDDQFGETSANNSLGIVPRPTPGDEVVGKKALVTQGDYVASKRKALIAELGREMQKLSEPQPAASAQPASTLQNAPAQSGAKWSLNNAYNGTRANATPAQSNSKAKGSLYLNDNIVLQNREAPPSHPPANRSGDATKGSVRIEDSKAAPQAGAPAEPVNPLDVGPPRAGRGAPSSSGVNSVRGAIPAGIPSSPRAPVAPAAAPMPGLEPVPAAPAPPPQTPPKPLEKSEAERLQPTGRISLAVDFPTEGEVYHFEKVKADARLELTVTDPSVFGRWRNLVVFLLLGGALYGAGRLLDKRSHARTQRAASAQ